MKWGFSFVMVIRQKPFSDIFRFFFANTLAKYIGKVTFCTGGGFPARV